MTLITEMSSSKAKVSCSGTAIPAFKFNILSAMPFNASHPIDHSGTAASTHKVSWIELISSFVISQPGRFESVRESKAKPYIKFANYVLPQICTTFMIPAIVRSLAFTAQIKVVLLHRIICKFSKCHGRIQFIHLSSLQSSFFDLVHPIKYVTELVTILMGSRSNCYLIQ